MSPSKRRSKKQAGSAKKKRKQKESDDDDDGEDEENSEEEDSDDEGEGEEAEDGEESESEQEEGPMVLGRGGRRSAKVSVRARGGRVDFPGCNVLTVVDQSEQGRREKEEEVWDDEEVRS
jgi:hypothetical protein